LVGKEAQDRVLNPKTLPGNINKNKQKLFWIFFFENKALYIIFTEKERKKALKSAYTLVTRKHQNSPMQCT